MTKELVFSKLVAAGNDFIVADNRRGTISGRAAAAKRLCSRRFSVGADGLILVESSKKADVRMRIFNPDGSEAEMCGNGVRCLALFAVDQRIVRKEKFIVETGAGIVETQVRGGIVKVLMSQPKDVRLNFSILLQDRSLPLHFIDTGVPHAVHVVPSIEGVDVEGLGRGIRTHEHFLPRGTNANFIVLRPRENAIQIRTYERGVEAETLSCGTGSTAGALIASLIAGLRSPVRVMTKSGENLKIYFSKKAERFEKVYLEGKVQKCFEGRVTL